jgi:D-3-phosphoglycerate dehydrogenase
LVEVKTTASDGGENSVSGTLLGKANDPRIVEVDGNAIEVRPVDLLLVVRNVDKPGIVGKLGKILGDHGVNIANMSLSRADCGELALTICELDEEPDQAVLGLLEAEPDIREARISRQS